MTLDRPPAKRNKRLDLLPPCKLASRGACRTFLQVTQATGRKPPPQVIAACTPRPSALTVELLKGQLGASEQAIFTRAPGHENRANLPPSFSPTILSARMKALGWAGRRSRASCGKRFPVRCGTATCWSIAALSERPTRVRAVVAIDPGGSDNRSWAPNNSVFFSCSGKTGGYPLR